MTPPTPAAVPVPPTSRDDAPALPSRRALRWVWLAYALLTLGLLGHPPVDRVQEARVLESSREMLDATTFDGWMRPTLAGEPRLRKPPLCYWYTAVSYRAFGDTDEFAGRVPTLLIGWATIAVVGAFGRDLGGRRLGFFAAVALAGGLMFVRFLHLAETDPPCMLGVAVAGWAIVRGSRARGRIAWFLVATLGISFAATTKGAPGLYPLVFLVGLSIANRSWRPLRRFALSGAPLVALALIVPWFVYVLRAPGGEQVGQEVGVVLSGANHAGHAWNYLPALASDLLPWTGWFAVALVACVATRRRFDYARRVALLMIGCVALPLAVAGNVQAHYLLPILPGCALLVAWWVARVTADDAAARLGKGFVDATRFVLGATVTALAAAPFVVVAIGAHKRGLAVADGITALVAGAAAAWLIGRHRRASFARQHAALALAMLFVMPVVMTYWSTSLKRESLRVTAPRALAAIEARLGPDAGPYLGLGDNTNVELGYYLRRTIRITKDPADVVRFAAANPNGVVVVERSLNRRAVPIPDPFMPERLRKIVAIPFDEDAGLEFYATR